MFMFVLNGFSLRRFRSLSILNFDGLYFIPRFSIVGIFFVTHVQPARSMFPWNSSRTRQQNQLKIGSTSTYLLLFIMSPPLGDEGIQFYRPFVKKWFLCNNKNTAT